MNRMKTNKELSVILSLVLCLALAISTPIFAATGESNSNKGNNIPSDTPYAENEAIVCYVDSEDVNHTALEEEIEKAALVENVAEDASDNVSLDVDEQLELVDVVDDSDELMDLGNQPIEEMKHVKKNVIKKKKLNKGKAKQKMSLVKSKKYSTEQLVKKLKALPNVEFAEPNYIEKPTATGDYTSDQWAYNTTYGLHVPNWNQPDKHNADDVVVAVLDTGVDYNNEDLKDVMWSKSTDYHGTTNFGGGEHGIDTSATTSNGQKDPMDVDGHGSHCAGIIGAAWNGFGVSGAANGVKIMAVKAGDSDGFYSNDLVEGMEYILEAKKAGVNIVAVNNSWGGDPKSSADSYVTAMKNLGKAGVISVFASGNEYSDCDANYGSKKYPKYYQAYFFKDLDCKLVGNNSDIYGIPRDSSNWGATTTDVYAPGTSIYSTYLSSKNTYATLSGTSMASPAVAGEVAILRAAYPQATIQQIIEAIRNNVTPDGNNKNTRKLKACISGGYANVEKALNALESIGHDVSGQPWVSEDATTHWKNCTTPGCTIRHSEAAHSGGTATCQNQAVCATCGAKYGSLAEHKWVQNGDTKQCSECGAVSGNNYVVKQTEITEQTTVDALNSALPSNMKNNNEAIIKHLDISLETQPQSPTGNITITVPYTWFVDTKSFDPRDAQYYQFAVIHKVGDTANSINYRIASTGLEITVDSFSPFAIGYVEKNVETGDFDGDGTLTTADISAMCDAWKINKISNKQRTVADYKKDEIINIYDVIALRRAIG